MGVVGEHVEAGAGRGQQHAVAGTRETCRDTFWPRTPPSWSSVLEFDRTGRACFTPLTGQTTLARHTAAASGHAKLFDRAEAVVVPMPVLNKMSSIMPSQNSGIA